MPRFMMLMHPASFPEAGEPLPANQVEAMMRFNEELTQAGVLLALDGLMQPDHGARVRFEGGRPIVTDGPFTEAKELVGGYWIIQASSQEEAVQWATRCPAGDGDMIEVRPIQQYPDDLVLSSEPPEQTSAP
jgi:hypothetical protein